MEQGMVLDRGQSNQKHLPEWVEGMPERSFWVGVKTKGKETHTVFAFRCPRCGLLQYYALE
jgi:hypothetical protein